MKKLYRSFSLLLCITLVASLCSCACRHEWQEATCTEPKTCIKCGETEGEALGHNWKEATVDQPQTCSRCGLTEGSSKKMNSVVEHAKIYIIINQ